MSAVLARTASPRARHRTIATASGLTAIASGELELAMPRAVAAEPRTCMGVSPTSAAKSELRTRTMARTSAVRSCIAAVARTPASAYTSRQTSAVPENTIAVARTAIADAAPRYQLKPKPTAASTSITTNCSGSSRTGLPQTQASTVGMVLSCSDTLDATASHVTTSCHMPGCAAVRGGGREAGCDGGCRAAPDSPALRRRNHRRAIRHAAVPRRAVWAQFVAGVAGERPRSGRAMRALRSLSAACVTR